MKNLSLKTALMVVIVSILGVIHAAHAHDDNQEIRPQTKDFLSATHFLAPSAVSVRWTPHDMICTQEQEYINKRRMHKVAQACKAFSINASTIPTIALAFSGGGLRAFIISLGFLEGLEQEGIFDLISYIAALSGSAWGLGSWMHSQMSLSAFKHYLLPRFSKGLQALNHTTDMINLVSSFLGRNEDGHSLSSIDLYSLLLSHNFLGSPDQQTSSFVKSHTMLFEKNYPIPIYACIAANKTPYVWMEVTPWELGSSALCSYVPIEAYGSYFEQGACTRQTTPLSLGYFLGIFGSAHNVTLQELVMYSPGQLETLKKWIPKSIYETLFYALERLMGDSYSKARFFPSQLPNYTWKMNNTMLSDQQHLTLIDAGIDFNIPLPALLRKARNIDLIIIFDSSHSVEDYYSLRLASMYAQKNNLCFPSLNSLTAPTCHYSFLESNCHKECPGIIYIPRLKYEDYDPDFDLDVCIQKEWCATLNFAYSKEQIEKLWGLGRHTAKKHSLEIINAIKKCCT